MGDQTELFGAYVPHEWTSDTSEAAAVRKRPTAVTDRDRVYAHIVCRFDYGATDKEVQVALKMAGSTQRPRRVELADRGLIEKNGQKRDRCSVWIAV